MTSSFSAASDILTPLQIYVYIVPVNDPPLVASSVEIVTMLVPPAGPFIPVDYAPTNGTGLTTITAVDVDNAAYSSAGNASAIVLRIAAADYPKRGTLYRFSGTGTVRCFRVLRSGYSSLLLEQLSSAAALRPELVAWSQCWGLCLGFRVTMLGLPAASSCAAFSAMHREVCLQVTLVYPASMSASSFKMVEVDHAN